MSKSALSERERARIPKGNVSKLRDWFLTVASESSPQLQKMRASATSAASPNQPPPAIDRIRSRTAVQLPALVCKAMEANSVMVTSATAASQQTIAVQPDNDVKSPMVLQVVKDALDLNGSNNEHAAVPCKAKSGDDNESEWHQAAQNKGDSQETVAKCTSNGTLVETTPAGKFAAAASVVSALVKRAPSKTTVLQPIGPSESRDRARHRRRLLDGSLLVKPQVAPHVYTDRRDVTPKLGWLRGTTPAKLAKIMTAYDNMQLDMLIYTAIVASSDGKYHSKGYDRYGEWPATTADHYLNRFRKFLGRSDHVVRVVQSYIGDSSIFDERNRIAHFEKWIRVAEYLVALNNMHSFIAVVTALQLSPLFKRRATILTKQDNEALSRLLAIASPSSNFAQVRLRQGPTPVPPPPNMDLEMQPSVQTMLNPHSNLTPFVVPWITEIEAAQAAQGLGLPGSAQRVQDMLDDIKATFTSRVPYSAHTMNVYLEEFFYRNSHHLKLYDPAWNWYPPGKRTDSSEAEASSVRGSMVTGSL